MKKGKVVQKITPIEIIFNFFIKSFELNVDRNKIAFLTNRQILRGASSHAFSYGIFRLFMELCNPIIKKENIFNKIDF